DVALAAAAQLHQARVRGDAVEPRRERGLALEVRQAAVRGQERVLERLGGVVLVAEDLGREPEDAVAIAADELVEAAVVPRLRPIHELRIAQRAVLHAHAGSPLHARATRLGVPPLVRASNRESYTISP